MSSPSQRMLSAVSDASAATTADATAAAASAVCLMLLLPLLVPPLGTLCLSVFPTLSHISAPWIYSPAGPGRNRVCEKTRRGSQSSRQGKAKSGDGEPQVGTHAFHICSRQLAVPLPLAIISTEELDAFALHVYGTMPYHCLVIRAW